MAELIEEMREHWRDGYWWADRQLLLAVVVGLVGGVLSLAFKYCELRMTQAMVSEA
jgi:hypothetical protein